jgi:hypothetical protein
VSRDECEQMIHKGNEGGPREGTKGSLLLVLDLEGREEHRLVGEVDRDGLVDVQKEAREARGEVGEEPVREVAKVRPYSLGQVLIVMFLRVPGRRQQLPE